MPDVDDIWDDEEDLRPFTKPVYDPKVELSDVMPERPLEHIPDKELIRELRARGRLVELTAECVAPGHAVNMGYPIKDQWGEIGRILGDELVQLYHAGHKPFLNAKVARGYYEHEQFGRPMRDNELHRKVSVKMYYLRAK